MNDASRHEMDPVERMVSRVLRAGIVVAVASMLAGVLLGAARGDGLPDSVVVLGDLSTGLLDLDPAAYLSLGLLALIATPFVRVIGSIAMFALQRDRRYVLVTAVVLVVMCLGVLLGKV